MGTRIASGLIGLALFIGLCFAGEWPFTIGVTMVALLGAWEWSRAYGETEAKAKPEGEATSEPASPVPSEEQTANGEGPAARSDVSSTLLCLLGAGFPLLVASVLRFRPVSRVQFALLLGAFVLALAARLPRASRTGAALGRLRRVWGLIGMIYIGLLISGLVLLRGLPESVGGSGNGPEHIAPVPFGAAEQGAWLLLLVTSCVWATDTFAYFVGRSLGRRKLAPSLSPKKTVEGAAGGLLGALLVGAGFATALHLPAWHGLAVGAIAGVFGPLGDLWESALKRELGLKDFGSIMPGHGGILDRFDSLLFVAPLAYLYLRFIADL